MANSSTGRPLSASEYSSVTPARWVGGLDGHLEMLDQRLLPGEETWLEYRTGVDVAGGIKDMVIRGAPAIGLAAAYGVALAVRDAAAGACVQLVLRATDPRLCVTQHTRCRSAAEARFRQRCGHGHIAH